MRVEWDLQDFDLDRFRVEFAHLAESLAMQWRIEVSSSRPRVAILVSHYLHCLADILYRHNSGELGCAIELVIGNHPDGEVMANRYGVPFHHIPITKGDIQAEKRQRELLSSHAIDLIVLARYMQILSPEFVADYRSRIINVHHSFLPAFIGSKPYHQAFARGVKLIGASSHYVTERLDEGPIIEQDVARISHRDQVEDLVAIGRDLERMVLSRAVRWHLEHRILCYDNKTVVFN
jgi:formyltetrahydrofolate deformylase